MIYKDANAPFDLENYPAVRSGDCLNCGGSAYDHNGWECELLRNVGAPAIRDFSKLSPDRRFITMNMAHSIGVSVYGWAHSPPPFPIGPLEPPGMVAPSVMAKRDSLVAIKDPTQWQAWAHTAPGDCKCGIPKPQCEYHR